VNAALLRRELFEIKVGQARHGRIPMVRVQTTGATGMEAFAATERVTASSTATLPIFCASVKM
jgi:hypothetical protein